MLATPGRLIIEFVPDEETKKTIIAFFAQTFKGRSENEISKWLSNLPAGANVVLTSEESAIITSYLAGLGVKARFAPSDPATGRDVGTPGPSPSQSTGTMPGKRTSEPENTPSPFFVPPPGRQSRPTTEPTSSITSAVVALAVVLCVIIGISAAIGRIHPGLLPLPGIARNVTGNVQSPARQEIPHNPGGNHPSGEVEQVGRVKYVPLGDSGKWAELLYVKKDFEAVEQHVSSLLLKKDDPARMQDLSAVYRELGHVTGDIGIDGRKSVLDEWCKHSPNSHIPMVVMGRFYIEHAWLIRGTKFAKEVPKEAWPVFNRLIVEARDVLERSWTMNPADPNSSSSLIIVDMALSNPRSTMEQHYQNAIAVCPVHYMARRHKLEYLKPKWQGSQAEMFEFAYESLNGSERNPYLGLLLVEAFSELHDRSKDKDVLGKDEVWQTVEKMYGNFFEKYPQDIGRRIAYAYLACKAHKWDVAYGQFEIIGDRWTDTSDWRSIEEYNKNRAIAYYKRGEGLLIQEKDYAGSRKYFQLSIDFEPSPNGYYGMAMSYWYQGYPAKDLAALKNAESFMVKAIELAPDETQWISSLKKLRECLKNYGAES